MSSKTTRSLLTLAALAVGGVATYWTILATRQERILFDTRRLPSVQLPEGFSTYSLMVPGGLVRGYIYHPDGEDALTDVLVYIAGRGEDVRDRTEAVRDLPAGVGFAALNYRGVADSEGLPSEAASIADVYQFVLHLRRAFPSARLHLVGRSLGTGVAVQLAAMDEFASLQLITPYDSLLEVAKKRFPMVPLAKLLRHQFNSLAHCRAVAEKTQVLLAENDDVVEHSRSRRLIDAWPGAICVQTIEGSDHHSIVDFPSTWQALGEFALGIPDTAVKVA